MDARTRKKKLTRGQRVIRFIESYCVVPEGDHMGKPVVLIKFQKKFILAVYDNPKITDTAILSIARKNAKTALIAFIMLAHLVGPESVQNSRIISGAMSQEQAGEVFNLASKCVKLSPKLTDLIRIKDSGKTMIGLPMNVEYKAISADKHTAHGKSPILAILDEVGQIRGPRSDFVDAITTAQGAYTNALIIFISTQAATDKDLFSVLIDDAQRNKPPKTVCHVYAADKDCNVLDEDQWKKANPALGEFRSYADMKKQAEKASRIPSFENAFRNLNLNQRVAPLARLFGENIWKACGDAIGELKRATKIYGGLDLSGRTDLTAFILYALIDAKWHVFCWFWTPDKGVMDRADRDKVPYDLWVKSGELLTTPGATVDYETVAIQLGEICQELEIQGIAYDRWRMPILKKELEKIGVDLPLIEWGQGYKDMGPAIDAIEEHFLNGIVCHGNHPVLTMCNANAVVIKDPAGNRKLDKDQSTGRIDGMVALAMAAGLAVRMEDGIDIDSVIDNPLILGD